MGILDRDYMRRPTEEQELGKPRTHVKKSTNKPAFTDRVKFWLWNLKNKQ